MYKRLKALIIRCLALILVFFIEIYRKFKPVRQRIYFCFNQSIHQVYHSIFVAVELSNLQKEYEVVVFSTSLEASLIIESELSSIPNNVRFVRIHHPGYRKTDFNVNWFVFLCRMRMYKPLSVVATDYFDNVFRQLLLRTFWVFVNHGVINRAYGSEPHIKDYDLIVLPGDRDLIELKERIGLSKNYLVLGYSKLDYFRYHDAGIKGIFKDKKPVVIYNPHFEKSGSSFFNKGLELLRALSESGKYNIIFMPHPDLSRKHPELIHTAKNIPGVFLAERLKINLLYMAIADIYITDVSSSVFEWLYFNKPVLFFNAHKINWQNNRCYSSWALGEVVDDVPDMLNALDNAFKHPQYYHEKRQEAFNNTFANRDKNASKIIAAAIWERLK